MPTVAVILPTYNRAHLLARAVDSVLAQTYGDFELIVVDDGSTDDTGRLLAAYDDPRLRLIQLDHNVGAAQARNIGIEGSQAPFVTFQDSDDEWQRDKLAVQMAAMAAGQPEVDVVYSAFWYVNGALRQIFPPQLRRISGRLPWAPYRLSGDLRRTLARGNVVQSPLVKRACLEQAGLFDPAFPRWHDWELWLRLAKVAHFSFIQRPLFTIYFTRESITGNNSALVTSLKQFKVKYRLEMAQEPLLAAHILFTEGNLLIHTGNEKQGRRQLWAALARFPFNPFHIFAVLSSYLGLSTYRRMVRLMGLSYGIDG